MNNCIDVSIIQILQTCFIQYYFIKIIGVTLVNRVMEVSIVLFYDI